MIEGDGTNFKLKSIKVMPDMQILENEIIHLMLQSNSLTIKTKSGKSRYDGTFKRIYPEKSIEYGL